MTTTTNSKVNFETFESYSDGSGASAIAKCYGLRFGVCVGSIDSITLSPLFSTEYQANGRTKGIRSSAASLVKSAVRAELDSLGAEWAAKNREMYA
jgi:hypothetical protein